MPLTLLRALTVVNDNVLRWLAIGLGKRAVGGGEVALVLTLGTAGFVLPFVLLAWLAGWLADRYPKRSVIVWCKAAEILIVAAAAGAVAWGVRSGGVYLGLPAGLWALLATVAVIGCQAALLAPSVIGTIPESVPPARLSQANGIFALVTLAATLIGMAGGNWLADGTAVPQPEVHAARPHAPRHGAGGR
ncbi:MAG: MFS transporter, partial [Planctomycetia bacterium]